MCATSLGCMGYVPIREDFCLVHDSLDSDYCSPRFVAAHCCACCCGCGGCFFCCSSAGSGSSNDDTTTGIGFIGGRGGGGGGGGGAWYGSTGLGAGPRGGAPASGSAQPGGLGRGGYHILGSYDYEAAAVPPRAVSATPTTTSAVTAAAPVIHPPDPLLLHTSYSSYLAQGGRQRDIESGHLLHASFFPSLHDPSSTTLPVGEPAETPGLGRGPTSTAAPPEEASPITIPNSPADPNDPSDPNAAALMGGPTTGQTGRIEFPGIPSQGLRSAAVLQAVNQLHYFHTHVGSDTSGSAIDLEDGDTTGASGNGSGSGSGSGDSGGNTFDGDKNDARSSCNGGGLFTASGYGSGIDAASVATESRQVRPTPIAGGSSTAGKSLLRLEGTKRPKSKSRHTSAATATATATAAGTAAGAGAGAGAVA
jgi:hypothetical protein